MERQGENARWAAVTAALTSGLRATWRLEVMRVLVVGFWRGWVLEVVEGTYCLFRQYVGGTAVGLGGGRCLASLLMKRLTW